MILHVTNTKRGIFIGHLIIWVIVVLSLAIGAITFFMKRNEQLFWSLFSIMLTNLVLGLFFQIYVNTFIGLLLCFAVIAMVGLNILRSRRSSI
ncbi:hypothetical protein AUC31_14580 [Planococcus rifietoensis]|uniref:Uncharacterized protein n=1 Tax=Planococcus rifietoensis TaxID=200991 RepID=A0A0U2YNZ9_9BACL|nr:hypothetical protein AUC31_14580 [Planococcus rifietoensis]